MRSNAIGTAALGPSPVRSAESHEHASVPLSCLFSLWVSITLTSQFVCPVPLIFSSCLSLLTHLHHLFYCHNCFRFPSLFFFACKDVSSPKALCPVFSFLDFFSRVMSFFSHYFQTSLVYTLNWYSPNINSVHLSWYKTMSWSRKMN